MKCIILGAGEGNRLRPHTLDRPKCLVELNGHPLLDYIESSLRDAGVTDIHVVTGYLSELIESRGGPTSHNPRYASTNMVVSLMAAADLFDGEEDLLIAYADIVFEPRVVTALAASDAPVSIAVNHRWRELWELRMENPLEDAETLLIDQSRNVLELGKTPRSYEDVQGQYMGLIKVRADHVGRLREVFEALDPAGPHDGKDRDNMYMTTFLQHWIDNISSIRAVGIDGGWIEVDTTEDLDLYHRLLAESTLSRHCILPELAPPG